MGTPTAEFVNYVLGMERSSARKPDAVSLWDTWCAGLLEVRAFFNTPDRSYLVLGRRPAVCGRLEGRERRIVEAALCGATPKELALDLGLSISTVASILKRGLTILGFDCAPSRVPVLLHLVLRAARAGRELDAGLATEFTFGGELLQSVSVPRPERALHGLLSPAEYAAIALLISGETYKNMAMLRQRSPRTIANQLSSAFQRLGVSGRGGVVAHLISRPASHAAPLGSMSET